MAVVGMKQLLEAGVHFGHQTRRWNPKMKPYIYTERNGIHIIDLQKTVSMLEKAHSFVQDVTRDGGRVLFVGTKKQAQEAVAEEATRAGQFYVNQRWLGGLLTNFQTIQQRLRRLDELERMRETGVFERLPKKEQLKLNDQMAKLTKMLGGIRGMKRLPQVLFIIDTKKEHIAIHEARRLDIPIVALLDTNSDPDEVDYAIPANDDAIRAVRLLSGKIADAAYMGAQERASTIASEEAEEGLEPEDYEGGYSADPEGYDASLDALDVDEDDDESLHALSLNSEPDEAFEDLETLSTDEVNVAEAGLESPVSVAEPADVSETDDVGTESDISAIETPADAEELETAPILDEAPAAKK